MSMSILSFLDRNRDTMHPSACLERKIKVGDRGMHRASWQILLFASGLLELLIAIVEDHNQYIQRQ